MENLISKWKQTVEMHGSKLTHMRDNYLTASQNKSVGLQTSSMGLFSLGVPIQSASFGGGGFNQSEAVFTVNLKNQAKLKQRSLSSSSRSSFEDKKNLLKEKQASNNNLAVSSRQQQNLENENLRKLIESVLQVYPEIRLKAKRVDTLQELIEKQFYSQAFFKLAQLRSELKEQEARKRQQAHKNEEVTQRVAELKDKIQESERQRAQARQRNDRLVQEIEELSEVKRQQKQQDALVQMLRRSQKSLETANQRLEQAFLESKRRFCEIQEGQELEMQQVKALLQNRMQQRVDNKN